MAQKIGTDYAHLLKDQALKFVGDKVWTGELALRLGAHLAQAANSARDLSGPQKCELVCQTILALLDDAEKAGKEHAAESTEKVSSIIHLDEIRTLVKTHLPVTLNLIVSAARGEFSLKKTGVGLLSWVLPYLPRLVPCIGASAVAVVSQAATEIVKKETSPQPPIEFQLRVVQELPKESETQPSPLTLLSQPAENPVESSPAKAPESV
jgi:hypothetical protein